MARVQQQQLLLCLTRMEQSVLQILVITKCLLINVRMLVFDAVLSDSHHSILWYATERDLEKQPLLQKNDSDVDLRSGMDTKHKVIPETDGAGSGASARTRRTAATGESEVPASGPSPSKDRRSSSSGGIDTASEPQSMFEKLKSRWPGVTRTFGVSTADGRESPPS
eukprot:gb/GECG01013154.1/.p1 GENE.gb/GECG01013154.1/~~gb/GECG01013154.1/.p1  ORF type:complete len:167 (+),score=23.89 gb/GECG01013154.1/:1-501(+)